MRHSSVATAHHRRVISSGETKLVSSQNTALQSLVTTITNSYGHLDVSYTIK